MNILNIPTLEIIDAAIDSKSEVLNKKQTSSKRDETLEK